MRQETDHLQFNVINALGPYFLPSCLTSFNHWESCLEQLTWFQVDIFSCTSFRAEFPFLKKSRYISFHLSKLAELFLIHPQVAVRV